MPVRGANLIRRFLAVLRRHTNFPFQSKYWYTTTDLWSRTEGRFYLVHSPSASRYDRVCKNDDNSVDVTWLEEEVRKWSRAEERLTEEKKSEYGEKQRIEGYVTTLDFGGAGAAKEATICPLSLSAEREMLREMNVEDEMLFFERTAAVAPEDEEEEEEVEYEERVSEDERDEKDDEDYEDEGPISSKTRGAKRMLEEKENHIGDLKKKLKDARKAQAKCCVPECERVGDGMRCCGGHAFCVAHSQDFAQIRNININPVCFDQDCQERLILKTMKSFVAPFIFKRMRADEERAAVASQEVRYDKDTKSVCVSVKELECAVCQQVATRPVNVECETRRGGEACEMIYCEDCVCRMRGNMKKCPTCGELWNGDYSNNLFLKKMCDKVPADHK